MKMTPNKVIIILVMCVAIFYGGMWKAFRIQSHRYEVKHAVGALILEQSKMGKETSWNDKDIIVAKILPKSNAYYTLNLFTWTLKQMSANDDLLQACLDARDRDDAVDAAQLEADQSTFEGRFKTWEINLEKAKLSLSKSQETSKIITVKFMGK